MFSREQAPIPGFSKPIASFLPKSQPAAPGILISRRAYALISLYVEIASQEVGWLGTVKRLANGDFYIENCYLFKQQVHESETEITNEGLSDLSMELLDKVDMEAPEEEWEVNKLRFWGHSHVRMPTRPSITDERTMLDDFGTGRSAHTGQERFCFESSGYPWVIRGIFNKHGEVDFAIFLYDEGLKFESVKWTVEEPDDEQLARFKAEDEQAREKYRQALIEETRLRRQEEKETLAIGSGSIASPGDPQKAETDTADTGEAAAQTVTPLFAPLPVKPAVVTRRPYVMSSFLQSLKSAFTSPRDPRYRPDITPELRSAVEEEFRLKVRSVSRSNFWSGSNNPQNGYLNKPAAGEQSSPVYKPYEPVEQNEPQEPYGDGYYDGFSWDGPAASVTPPREEKQSPIPAYKSPSWQSNRDVSASSRRNAVTQGDKYEEPGLIDFIKSLFT